MVIKVKKGNHYSSTLLDKFPFILFFKNRREFTFQFLQSCRYDLGTQDQLDTNKLFGVSSLSGVHKNSARFGWRYNLDTEKIDLFSYLYLNGERRNHYIDSVNINQKVKLTIHWTKERVYFLFNDDLREYYKLNLGNIVLVNGLYFGGNRTAPHDIEINRT